MTRLAKALFTLALAGCTIAAAAAAGKGQAGAITVLIVDGANNHDWPRMTRYLQTIFEGSGRFAVAVSTSPPAREPRSAWDTWRPQFDDYDVVVNNFNGGHLDDGLRWPARVEAALETYVRQGGGLVNVHAANNAFLHWQAFNEMIGLGWRSKDFGPSLIVSADGRLVRIPAGEGLDPGHGPEHDFMLTVFTRDHPITRGLPEKWMHPHEQLTHGQHGPAQNMTVLHYAYSKDTKENEVMDWVIPYGEGRVYTTMLGHLWKDGPNTAVSCAGFQTLLLRGTEWAATGRVTIPVPADFPTATKISLRDTLPEN
jgi:uncharacterized protein